MGSKIYKIIFGVKPIKITYITSDYFPQKNAGVARARSYVEEMVGRGYDVEVITCLGAKSITGERLFTTLLGNPQGTKGLTIRLLREVFFVIEVVARLLMTNKERTVIVSSPPFMGSIIPVIFGSKFRSVILDVRDLYPDVFFHSGVLKQTSCIGRIFCFIEKKAYDCSSAVVTVCGSLLTSIESRTCNKKLVLVANGYPKAFSARGEGCKFFAWRTCEGVM